MSRLVDARLDVRMHDVVLVRRAQAGAEIARSSQLVPEAIGSDVARAMRSYRFVLQ